MPIVGSFAGASARAYGASAGVLVGDFESIQTITLTANQTNVEFTSVPQTYTHLQVRVLGQDDRATYADDNMKLQFNLDTATNYSAHFVKGGGASASTFSQSTVSSMLVGSVGTGNGNFFGLSIIDILDYANTNKYKTVRYIAGIDVNGTIAGAGGSAILGSGNWRSSSAVTSIKFTPFDATNFKQYSSFALYGVKA